MTGLTDNHPITIEPNRNRVRVIWRGQVVADSVSALSLREASYPPVLYIPRDDVDFARLVPTTHQTRCPYKGLASYYTIVAGGSVSENAAWSYEKPLPAAADIAGHLAFYPNRVDRIEEAQA